MSFLKNIFGSNKEDFEKPNVLLEEPSPSCPITAIIEQDNRTAYLYLWGPEDSSFGVKSCWIRNLKEAPDDVESKLMEKGIPPMLPKRSCVNPLGLDKLKKEDLTLVWLEEGDAVALLEKGQPIAIIPSWSGQGGFYGYSKECKGEGEFAWELNTSNEMLQRVNSAQNFWDLWESEINPFQILQPKILAIYDEHFGESEKYFAIDDEQGAPRGLYVLEGKQKTVFATVALSLSPMPQIEMYTENRFDLNRIELGMMLGSEHCESNIQTVASWFSGACAIPWKNITFLGEGHTIAFDAFNHPKFKSVLLTSKVAVLPKVEMENYNNSRINFLWLIPITEKERQYAIDEGSESIIDKINEIGNDVFSLDRKELI